MAAKVTADGLVDEAVRAVELASKLVIEGIKDASADETAGKRAKLQQCAMDFASAIARLDAACPPSEARVQGEVAVLKAELEAKAALEAKIKAALGDWLQELKQRTEVDEVDFSEMMDMFMG